MNFKYSIYQHADDEIVQVWWENFLAEVINSVGGQAEWEKMGYVKGLTLINSILSDNYNAEFGYHFPRTIVFETEESALLFMLKYS